MIECKCGGRMMVYSRHRVGDEYVQYRRCEDCGKKDKRTAERQVGIDELTLLTQSQIGEMLGISKTRVGQIERAALAKIRDGVMADRELRGMVAEAGFGVVE